MKLDYHTHYEGVQLSWAIAWLKRQEEATGQKADIHAFIDGDEVVFENVSTDGKLRVRSVAKLQP